MYFCIDKYGNNRCDSSDNQAHDYHGSQIEMQQIRCSQRVGGRRHQSLRNAVSDGESAYYIGQRFVHLFGNCNANGDQYDKGYIEEYGNSQYESGYCHGIQYKFIGNRMYNGFCNYLSSSGIAHELSQNHSKADRQSYAGHHIAKTRGNRVNGCDKTQSAGYAHIDTGND